MTTMYTIEHRFSHQQYSQAIEADDADAAYDAYVADPGDFTTSDDEPFDRDDLVISVRIPATREEAIEAIAALDAARWGEAERQASRRMHQDKSYGLLLNTLAHRPEYDFGDAVPHLVEAAKRALTDDDWADLRQGG